MSKPIDGGKFCGDCGGKCCRSCASAGGYFYQKMFVPDFERFTLIELELIVEVRKSGYFNAFDKNNPVFKLAKAFGVEFDPKDGFGGPTGCRLPREKRSRTCIKYFCPDLAKHLGIDFNKVYWNEITPEELKTNTPIDEYIASLKA